jgi:hypothetical protein
MKQDGLLAAEINRLLNFMSVSVATTSAPIANEAIR